MMDCEKVKKIIIDQLYGESMDVDISGHINNCSKCREYMESLQATTDLMDKIDVQIPADTLEITKAINGAFGRAYAKKKRIEAVYFVAAGLLILTSVTLATLTAGIGFFIVLQIVVVLNLPLLLIPILRSRNSGEELI